MQQESQEQMILLQWCRIAQGKYPDLKYIFHIPNERKCSPREGARLKTMGVRSGVPDLFLPVPRGEYHGLWIEMKSTSKQARVSEHQQEWLEALLRLGYSAHVCRGWEQARDVIERYLA